MITKTQFRPLKGIIFDKDGTLFDFNATWGQWALTTMQQESDGDPETLARLAEALGFEIEHCRFRPGSVVIAETLETVADVMVEHLPRTTHGALTKRLIDAAVDVPQIPAAPLVQFCTELLELGLVLGVATNDAEGPAMAHLSGAGILDQFAFIAGYDSGYGAKPASGQLDAFCAQTGLAADQCAMVGDSLHDLHAGRAAGMRTIGVLTGPAPESELAPFADIILPSIASLPGYAVEQM